MLRELSQLCRDDHRALRAAIKRARWERQVEQEETKAAQQFDEETRRKLCASFWARMQLPTMAEVFGGGEVGRRIAAFILEVQNDLPPDRLGVNFDTESKPPCAEAAPARADAIRGDSTESNQITPDQTGRM